MAEDVFRIQGRLLYEGGQPAEGLVVAVVDEDVIKDDLIGFGVTDSRGEFRLSFTKAAFNQEAFETESYPDIYIVVSLRVAGGLAPVLRRSFPGLGFAGTEDLGDIQLGELKVLEKQEPIPGKDKIARRLKLDDEVLASAAAEVAPLVESLTGWSSLLDGIKLLISDSLGHTFASILEAADGTSLHHRTQAERMFNSAFALSGIVALFDPFSRAIHVSRRSLERQGLDSLKVILGHELVHVGQFREFPSLIEAHRPGLRTTAARLRGEEDPSQSPTPADTFGLMANIEGYASHIEQDFLRKHYNCATPLLHVSALEIFSAVGSGLYGLLRTSLSGVDWAKDGEQESKQNQYGAGLRAYRALGKDGKPARFDPHLRPQNTAGEELDTALLEEQASWGNLDAIHQLARRLLETDSPEADLPRGIHLLQVAAEAGHGQAQCELGSRYFSGIGVELHYDLFVAWTRKAMQSDVPRAFYNMGLAHFLGTGVPEDHALGFRLFQEALERGYEPARVEVGSCLLRGQGVQADPTRAAAVLEEAAKNGSAEAYFWLGVMSQEGHGVPVNLAHAIEMFRTAAKGGIARAWGQLGAAFESGQGVKVDLTEALKCYENAAALGDLSAKNMVGVRLLRGNGIPRDPGRGLASLKEAAEAGDLDAMHNLALAQLNQESSFGALPLEAEEGLRWLTQAAEAGRAGSQIKLGQILLGGKLCPADYPRGAAWIRRGADAEIAFAQYLYGLCVLNGLGVPADAVEAKSWFQKAADQGYELAKEELAKNAASPRP